jgi:hypothetical protein
VPVERAWAVEDDQQPELSVTPEGDLLVQPRVVREEDEDALTAAVYEALAILRRVGGTIQVASQRAEIAPQVVVTESLIFAYNSFTPLVRRLGDQQPEETPFPPIEDTDLGDAIAEAQQEEPAGAVDEQVAAVE